MTNSTFSSSSRVGKEARHIGAAITATQAMSLVTTGGAALPLASVVGPVAMAGLPVALGVGLATYGVCKLLDRVFD